MEIEVEAALNLLLSEGALVNADQVKALVSPTKPTVPHLAVPEVNLASYDELLSEVAS